MALSGVGITAVLAILLLWLGSVATPLSAMEQMAEKIRQAKSFIAVMTAEGQLTPETGKPPVKHKVTATIYWLAPGSSRVDFQGSAPDANGGPSAEADVTKIDLPGESQEIIIDHNAKTFYKVELPKEVPGAEIVAKLGEFSGQADRELGTKEINGKKSRGFEIDMKKLFRRPDGVGVTGQRMAEIWIDTESSLPVLVQFKMTKDRSEETIWIRDFHWNIHLDPKLFDTTPPKGYTDDTPSLHMPPKSSANRGGAR
jgi:outer membrane lipoprotein-sorting protein